MSCCSSFCRSVGVDWSRSREVLARPAPGASAARPPRPGGPGRTLAGAPRARSTRSWGAGAPRGRVRCPRIGHDGRAGRRVRADDHPQQLALGGPLATSDAGPDRAVRAAGPGHAGEMCSRATAPSLARSRPCDVRTGRSQPYGRAMAGTTRPGSSDDFDGSALDERSGVAADYLPAWSSRAATARRRYRVDDSCLTLDIPPDQGDVVRRRPRAAAAGLRASSPATGPGRSAAPLGQQRFREGQVVREEQHALRGAGCQAGGHVEIRCRMTLSPRSMAALWMVRLRGRPARSACGELCVVEVFGKDARARSPSAEVGVGIKAFRDPGARRRTSPPPGCRSTSPTSTPYAVDWDADGGGVHASTARRSAAARARRRTRCS